MDGFSASGCFVNRFAALHPEAVRALAAGGVNGIPMLPLKTYKGDKLPYPLGIANLESLTGAPFNVQSYGQVSQYLYMGSLDTNDTLNHPDAWHPDQSKLIAKLFGEKMMPDRWKRSQEIIADLHIPIQTVTYKGVDHNNSLPEIWDDIFRFFKANEGDQLETITPHEYPLIPQNP